MLEVRMKLKTYKPTKQKNLVSNKFMHKPNKNAKYRLLVTQKYSWFATNAILVSI